MITIGKMTTIARPYALAAFEFALKKNALSAWETMLNAAALITQDPAVHQLLATPRLSATQLAHFYCDVLAAVLDHEMKNFIQLLTEYNRLAILPDISILFQTYRAAEEKKLAVQVTSASELTPLYQQKLREALSQRLQRQVSLECEVNPALLGGAVITAGDTVIDGSIRGKLDRMAKFISESV